MVRTETDWLEVYKQRAAIQAKNVREEGIETHELETTIGRVCVTFEEVGRDGRISGRLWTPTTVRVNNAEWIISTRYGYFLSESHWDKGKRIAHDAPIPIASFSSSDMYREGNHTATPNACWKAECAIGAAIAALDASHNGMLAAHAAANAQEMLAQEQERRARRARERAAEWMNHAERHDANAVAIRAGAKFDDYHESRKLDEARVY